MGWVGFQSRLGCVEVHFHACHGRGGCFDCGAAPRGTAVPFCHDPVLSQPHRAAGSLRDAACQRRGGAGSRTRSGQNLLSSLGLKLNSSSETFLCGENGEF